jgi:hypothetical protein
MNHLKRFAVFAVTLLSAAVLWPGPIAAVAGPGPLVSTANMNWSRTQHTATLLADGTVLVAGGSYCMSIYDGGGCDVSWSLPSAEIYHPGGYWSGTGSMATGRYAHTATRLLNGKVLVAGGFYEPPPYSTTTRTYLASAELYDPATASWSVTGSLNQVRSNAMATLLGDGTVLVASGGVGNSAELYHPDTGTWSATGSMTFGHDTMTRLPSGKVLAAGGFAGSAELYDPASGTWVVTGSMLSARAYESATLLKDGTVLVAGGNDALGAGLKTAEIYQPSTEAWSATASTANSHAYQNPTAVLLSDGTVLLADQLAEVYDPIARNWALAPGTTAMYGQSATLLNDGRVLIAGGCCDTISGLYLSSAQLYGAPASIPNDPPLAATGRNLSMTEGAQMTEVVATFTDADPNGQLAQYAAVIDWGDGSTSSGSISAGTSGFNVSGTHSYAEESTAVVTVSIVDSGGAATFATSPVIVNDGALALTGTSAALSAHVTIATTLALALLTDSDSGALASDYAVTIAWGDGSTSVGIITAAGGGTFAIAGAHAYLKKGTFAINVAASDVGGYAATPVTVLIKVSR